MTTRTLCCWALVCLLAASAFAQSPAADDIQANQNRTPAGKLENGVLTVHLEMRAGTWHVEAEDGPPLYVQAFGEAGQAAQIPGPLLRMKEGTQVHVTVANQLKKKATLYGLNTRPGDPKTAGIELEPGASREVTFVAGAPGTYYYWARTVSPAGDDQPYLADAQLNGAFVIDPAGEVPADRIFVIGLMFVLPDALHKGVEVVSINGKSYPYTEPLQYTAGDMIRWRVINPGASEHPMHLHGAFYQLLSLGDFEKDTAFSPGERQLVVTKDLMAGQTMMLQWTPGHEGRWLFHCHFSSHIGAEERVPELKRAGMEANPGDGSSAHKAMAMPDMNDMAGLVLTINVAPRKGAAPEAEARPVHKIDLVLEPTAEAGKLPTFTCQVREGKKMVVSQDGAMGPPMIVTRGEPTEVTVINNLKEPTTIHWHGLELDAYYDGVVGGGVGNQVTPAIPAGGTFVARFTPNRAGTFIYHTHSPDLNQLAGGVYGPLIVLEPGEHFDAEHDKVLALGSRDPSFFAKRITLNGSEQPSPIILKRGARYRLRIIDMGADLAADLELGDKQHPVSWEAIAKDGAALPAPLMQTSVAKLHIASGEVYDFQLQPETAGEIPLQVENEVNHAKLLAKIVVE